MNCWLTAEMGHVEAHLLLEILSRVFVDAPGEDLCRCDDEVGVFLAVRPRDHGCAADLDAFDAVGPAAVPADRYFRILLDLSVLIGLRHLEAEDKHFLA